MRGLIEQVSAYSMTSDPGVDGDDPSPTPDELRELLGRRLARRSTESAADVAHSSDEDRQSSADHSD